MPSHPHKAPRSRGWCFTLNNYTDDEFNHLQTIPCQYIIYGQEVGNSGTPHLQGYVHYKNQVSAGHVRATIGNRAHIEIRHGTLEQAITYCKKEGSYIERGAIRVPNENRWTDIIDLAKQGSLKTIEEEYPLIYFLHKKKLEELQCPELKPFTDNLQDHFEWWYGPTGTGKSKKVWELYPQHYDKQLNKWWDGYQYQDVVIIEECDPKKCEHMAYFFKRWCDRYPFRAEVKNGHLNNIRPKKIIITSNYTIKECFPNQQDYEPLQRRFKVTHFPFIDNTTPQQTPPTPAFHHEYNEPLIFDLDTLFED